ncbi:hypothetical protein OG326_41995 (plasmid) [Nocardia sp. NBC_01327]|nr:hypothetical protein OG326_41995 [Nocardia sp. NBC_01327]
MTGSTSPACTETPAISTFTATGAWSSALPAGTSSPPAIAAVEDVPEDISGQNPTPDPQRDLHCPGKEITPTGPAIISIAPLLVVQHLLPQLNILLLQLSDSLILPDQHLRHRSDRARIVGDPLLDESLHLRVSRPLTVDLLKQPIDNLLCLRSIHLRFLPVLH